jgi:signal transduction histidine kinase
VKNGLDLSGQWEFCTGPTLEKDALEVQNFSACQWKTIDFPSKPMLQRIDNQYGFFVLRKQFATPSFCSQLEDACSFIIGEMVGGQRAILNGTFIGEHGKFYRRPYDRDPYPAYFFISNSILRKPPSLNELRLLVYSPEGVITGPRRDPIAIVKNSAGITIVESLVAEVVVLPLLSGLGLLVMSIMSFISLINKTSYGDARVLKTYSWYCLMTGLFEISLSRLPRAYINHQMMIEVHFLLVFLSELSLLFLVSSYLKTNSLFIKLSRIFIFTFVGLISILILCRVMEKWVDSSFGLPLGLSYLITLVGSPAMLLPCIGGIFSSFFHLRGGSKYKVLFALFLLKGVMSVLDMLTLADFILGPFLARFYHFIVGLVLGHEIFKDRAQEIRDLAVSSRLGELAAQVAHDIRSPLAVLKLIESDPKSVSGEARTYLQAAVSRIHDIASDLLSKQKSSHKSHKAETAPSYDVYVKGSYPIDMSQFFEDLVRLKSVEFKMKSELRITFDAARLTDPVCIAIDPNKLNRVLSNLINNSVEAFSKNVVLGASGNSTFLFIQIADDGSGIPSSVLECLGEKGMSHDKEGGHGLGLFGAKSAIESVGGSLRINSSVGEGTVVTLAVPIVT